MLSFTRLGLGFESLERCGSLLVGSISRDLYFDIDFPAKPLV